jgi:hypothetical protein
MPPSNHPAAVRNQCELASRPLSRLFLDAIIAARISGSPTMKCLARWRLWLTGAPAFDADAKAIMRQGNAAASAAGHRYLGAGHILLGILDAAPPQLIQLREQLHLDLNAMRDRLLAHLPHAVEASFDNEPFANGKSVIQDALRLALIRKLRRVDAACLLWALASDRDEPASQVLRDAGLSRRVIASILFPSPPPGRTQANPVPTAT